MSTRKEMREFARETADNTNIVIMFSGEGTTLQAFIDTCWCANIIGAITDNPNAGGIKRCIDANIPCLSLPRIKDATKNDHELTILGHLHVMIANAGGIKYLVLAGYMRILSPGFIKHLENKGIKIINIHPSLLPKYPGLHTHKRVLDSGDTKHGMTIHYVDEGMDTGEILFQVECDVSIDDTEETLELKVKQLEQKFYPRIIDLKLLG
ncbi:MAG: phosphoribosylglycinamide formyltransferase [Methylotenera sp.]|nr:MAG: phosphoribosylglycinamide formyltransferase [Methylotenera sp.]